MTDNQTNTNKASASPPSRPARKKPKRNWSSSGSLPYDKIPAFKEAYDCYKECLHRFAGVPSESKFVAREVREKLMRVMVCIAHARLNILVLESLREATDLAIEVQVTIRVLVETHAISIKDYANISKYSENLVRQMVGWNNSEERKSASPEAASVQEERLLPQQPSSPTRGGTPGKPSPPRQQTLF